MELDERKLKILQAIIRTYLETGEPVGSRTISKYSDLNLSSATIRNEMSDLEEMGYILQPHTSAGRIPTDKGYRLYVDDLMAQKKQELEDRESKVSDREKEVDSMRDILNEKVDRVEELLQNVAKVLAKDTNYATMITAPQVKGNKLKFVQLSQLESDKILAVIVMEGNIIRNKVIDVSEALSQENILKLNILLNTTLTGLTLEQMNLSIVSKMENQAGEHMQLVKEVLDAIVEAISNEDQLEIYTSGATNIFKYPELSDNQSAQEIISAFEEKQQLSELVTQTLAKEDNTGIQVYIGDETPVQTMRDCSVVTATYELGDGMKGTIGIIGPKRMDYEHVLKSMKRLQTELDQIAQLDTYPSIGSGNLKKEVITQNGETITYDSENEDQAEDVAAVAGGLGAATLSEVADYSVDDADLTGYGLDETSKITVEVTYTSDDEDQTMTLYIGGENGSGDRYVRINDSRIVYLISDEICNNILNQ